MKKLGMKYILITAFIANLSHTAHGYGPESFEISQETKNIPKTDIKLLCGEYIIKDPCSHGGTCIPRGDEKREYVKIAFHQSLHQFKHQIFTHFPRVDQIYQGDLCQRVTETFKKFSSSLISIKLKRLFHHNDIGSRCVGRNYEENLILNLGPFLFQSKLGPSLFYPRKFELPQSESCLVPHDEKINHDTNFNLSTQRPHLKQLVYNSQFGDRYLKGQISIKNENTSLRFVVKILTLKWKHHKENYSDERRFMFFESSQNRLLMIAATNKKDISLHFNYVDKNYGYILPSASIVVEGHFVDRFGIPFSKKIQKSFSITTGQGIGIKREESI